MKIALAPIALGMYRSKPTEVTYKNDITTLLHRVSLCGYAGIEMGTPEGFTDEEFRACLDEANLLCVSASGLRYPALEGDDFSALLTQCRVLGAQNVMVSNMPNVVLGNPVELKKFIGHLNRVGRILMEGGGVHLSYHNHAVDFSKVGGATILQQIVENTDPRYVFLEPDTHWIQAGGGHVVTWLKALRGRIHIVHFKDYGIDPYSDHTYLECTHKLFMEVGEGNLNWPGILEECRAQNIPWCAVEQDRTQRPPYESLKLSVDNLRAAGL